MNRFEIFLTKISLHILLQLPEGPKYTTKEDRTRFSYFIQDHLYTTKEVYSSFAQTLWYGVGLSVTPAGTIKTPEQVKKDVVQFLASTANRSITEHVTADGDVCYPDEAHKKALMDITIGDYARIYSFGDCPFTDALLNKKGGWKELFGDLTCEQVDNSAFLHDRVRIFLGLDKPQPVSREEWINQQLKKLKK